MDDGGTVFQPTGRPAAAPATVVSPPPAPRPDPGPVQWSYVAALLGSAFVAPVLSWVVVLSWATHRMQVLMAHDAAPTGTEYSGMIAGMFAMSALAANVLVVLVVLASGGSRRRRRDARVAGAALLTATTAWFAFGLAIVPRWVRPLHPSVPDPQLGTCLAGFAVLVVAVVALWATALTAPQQPGLD